MKNLSFQRPLPPVLVLVLYTKYYLLKKKQKYLSYLKKTQKNWLALWVHLTTLFTLFASPFTQCTRRETKPVLLNAKQLSALTALLN